MPLLYSLQLPHLLFNAGIKSPALYPNSPTGLAKYGVAIYFIGSSILNFTWLIPSHKIAVGVVAHLYAISLTYSCLLYHFYRQTCMYCCDSFDQPTNPPILGDFLKLGGPPRPPAGSILHPFLTSYLKYFAGDLAEPLPPQGEQYGDQGVAGYSRSAR